MLNGIKADGHEKYGLSNPVDFEVKAPVARPIPVTACTTITTIIKKKAQVGDVQNDNSSLLVPFLTAASAKKRENKHQKKAAAAAAAMIGSTSITVERVPIKKRPLNTAKKASTKHGTKRASVVRPSDIKSRGSDTDADSDADIEADTDPEGIEADGEGLSECNVDSSGLAAAYTSASSCVASSRAEGGRSGPPGMWRKNKNIEPNSKRRRTRGRAMV